MKSTLARIAVLAIAISGPFAACSDNGDTSEFPVGVYHPPGSTDAGGTMEFKSDGTFVLVAANEVVVTEGTYSIDGDQLTWESDSFCKTESDAAESATYTWTEDDNLLIMTVRGEDLCTRRVEVIQTGFEKSDS
jgi:hypothetical protein